METRHFLQESISFWGNSSFFLGVFFAISFAFFVVVLLAIFHRYRLSQIQQEFFFRGAPIAFFRMDAKQNIIGWNLEAERITGYTIQEINKKKPNALIDVDISSPFFSGQQNILVLHKEGTIKTKHGNDMLISKNISCIIGKNGKAIEVIGSFEDMTEQRLQQKESEKKNEKLQHQQDVILKILKDIENEKQKYQNLVNELKQFQLAVENASDHIIITNAEGVVLFANKAMEKLTGFLREEIIGKKAGTRKNWGGLMDKETYALLWDTISNKKDVFRGEMRNRRKNGEIYDVNVSISPILDEKKNILFYVGIERDITSEKGIDKAKSEFVSLASHQLRTPLTTLNWYAELLLSGDAGKINREQREFLTEIAQGSQRMGGLVDSLLNVSRIDLGTLADSKPIDIEKTLDGVLQELSLFVAQKKMHIEKNITAHLPHIPLDSNLIHIVFQNLVGNAIKYTPEQGKISIDIHRENGFFKITISDTGYGIPKYQKDRIFSKLFRADNIQKKEVNGNGLGLYITKSIIEEFGGTIQFESKENVGTTFTVLLPEKGIPEKKEGKHLDAVKNYGISSESPPVDLDHEI